MQNIKQLYFICFLAMVSIFFACNNSENKKEDTTKITNEAAKGGKQYGGVFKVNEEEYFRTLYPLNMGEVTAHRIANQIYEGLVKLNQTTLVVEPSIAEKWTIDEAATTYTFSLRRGVLFHDDACFSDGKGREVTAKDIKYCLDLLCTQSADNKGFDFVKDRIAGARAFWDATAKGKKPAGGVEGVKVIDDYTVEIKLNQPFSSFLHILAMPFGYVFPKEAVEKYGKEMRNKTVGTGAFQMKTVKENETVILVRNPNYWGTDEYGNQLPFLDAIKVSFIKDQMSALLEFKQGNLDMIFRLPLELSDEIVSRSGELLGEYKQYQYQESAAMTMQYYGFLNTGKVFNDKKVRQAFCYAIDREKIVTHTVKGQGIPGIYGIAPPSFSTYDTEAIKGYNFDANKSRKLMAEAGFPEGKGFPELTLNINSGGGRNTQVAEAIQKMLQENLNIKVNISKMPFHQHLENTESAKFDFWRAGWVADYPDPENFLTLLWSDHLPKGDIAKGKTYLNTFRYKNAEFDRLFEEALKTVDEKKRNDLFRQADQIAISDAAYMPLFYAKDQRILQAHVKDFPQNAMEYRLLEKTYFTKK